MAGCYYPIAEEGRSMLKIRYPPRFAVIRAGQCACGASGPGGYASVEWRLASYGPERAERPAPADMRLLNGASHTDPERAERLAPADMRLLNGASHTDPERAAHPAPGGYASRVVRRGKGKNDGLPQTAGLDG